MKKKMKETVIYLIFNNQIHFDIEKNDVLYVFASLYVMKLALEI
jgi:hypothetical protein